MTAGRHALLAEQICAAGQVVQLAAWLPQASWVVPGSQMPVALQQPWQVETEQPASAPLDEPQAVSSSKEQSRARAVMNAVIAQARSGTVKDDSKTALRERGDGVALFAMLASPASPSRRPVIHQGHRSDVVDHLGGVLVALGYRFQPK
jgi:hypothetical protein